jgi:hypothetical protein
MIVINIEDHCKLMNHILSYLLDFILMFFSIVLVITSLLLVPGTATAIQEINNNNHSAHANLRLDMLSPDILNGTAGQSVKIEGKIINLGLSSSTTNNGSGIAYISIVDTKENIPVDLEDWSVEKGLYIPSIENGSALPLEWNVRLVKAGSYTVTIIYNTIDDNILPPIVSTRIDLEVSEKHNLNPGNILPVAFGVPTVLIALTGTLNYIRGRKTGIYT